MFTVIKWFFRLPWFLWLVPMVAAGWFALEYFQAFQQKTAEYQTLVEEPFEPAGQALATFDPAQLPEDGAVGLTAEIDWQKYYELGAMSSVLGDATMGYMLFSPGSRVVEGFAFFPWTYEAEVHEHIDAGVLRNGDYGPITAIAGQASVGHSLYESEVREWASVYGFETAETMVFLDVWPEGRATPAIIEAMNSFMMAVGLALGAGASFLMLIISGVARVVFGKRHKLDPTQLEGQQPDTFGRKAKRAGAAFGAAKSAGDYAFGGDSGGSPSLSDVADMGILDDVSDLLGPAGAVLKVLGKGDKRSTPLPEAVEPIAQRPMGKMSARTAALLAKQQGGPVQEHVTPDPEEKPARVVPTQVAQERPTSQPLSFKQKMRGDPFAKLAQV